MEKEKVKSTNSTIDLQSSRYSDLQFQKVDKIKTIKCNCGNNAGSICIQKECQASAAICLEPNSECRRKLHKSCFMIPLQCFSQKIYNKILDVDQYVSSFNKITDEFIDTLIDEASRIKDAFSDYAQTNYRLVLLNECQKKMWLKIQKNQINKMKGSQFAQLFLEIYQKNENKKKQSIDQDYENIKKMWKKFQERIKKQLKQFQFQQTKQLTNSCFLKNLTFEKSNIITKSQESNIMQNFFQKKVKNVKLLYKASQNEFKLDNFYKNCTNIPNTLVLIETQFGKKVGGYTPLVWKKVQKAQFLSDNSNSSFIFSLTNNQKLKQKSITESGISNDNNVGPYFRHQSGYDLRICQFANLNPAGVYFNYGYSNQTYKQRNKNTCQRFNGNLNNSYTMKLKEWEVWEVIYE